MTNMLDKQPSWRKSSHSSGNDTCVELAGTLDKLRDSKNPTGATLRCDIAALIMAAKTDRFTH